MKVKKWFAWVVFLVWHLICFRAFVIRVEKSSGSEKSFVMDKGTSSRRHEWEGRLG